MNSGVLHQEVRTRGPGSDSTSAVASAAGTTKVDPRYGDTAAVGAQQVIGAAADELDHGAGFVAVSTVVIVPGSASSLSPALRMAGAETLYVPAWTQKRVAAPEASPLMMASMSSPDVIWLPVQLQV